MEDKKEKEKAPEEKAPEEKRPEDLFSIERKEGGEKGLEVDQERGLERRPEEEGRNIESHPEEEGVEEFLEEKAPEEDKEDQPPSHDRGFQIEKILEKDLQDSFFSLDPLKQEEFKRKGEETARKIDVLLNRTRVKTEKIISLIRKWLSLLPGVNKFFLEKEAKKKAEEIIKLKED